MTLKTFIEDLVKAAIGFFENRIKIKYPLTGNLVLTNPDKVCVAPFAPPAADYDAGVGFI